MRRKNSRKKENIFFPLPFFCLEEERLETSAKRQKNYTQWLKRWDEGSQGAQEGTPLNLISFRNGNSSYTRLESTKCPQSRISSWRFSACRIILGLFHVLWARFREWGSDIIRNEEFCHLRIISMVTLEKQWLSHRAAPNIEKYIHLPWKGKTRERRKAEVAKVEVTPRTWRKVPEDDIKNDLWIMHRRMNTPIFF